MEIHNTCDKEPKEFSVEDLNEYLSDTLKIPLEFCENLEGKNSNLLLELIMHPF